MGLWRPMEEGREKVHRKALASDQLKARKGRLEGDREHYANP